MSLNKQQVDALLRPIHPSRVLEDNKGMAHVSQQDVRAHLTRIFGFGGWSDELLDLALIREAPGKDRAGKDKGWAVTYRATVRLTVRDPHGQFLASYDDVGTGTSPNLPTVGDAHDFACKVAVSMALKRAATNLGDGFGLSLYNKGQRSALVKGTLVMPEGEGVHVEDVPAQVSLGHDDAGSTEEPERSAERGPVAAESDPWAATPVRKPPDPALIPEITAAVAGCEDLKTLRNIRADVVGKARTGELPESDAGELLSLIDECGADLRAKYEAEQAKAAGSKATS